jgi:hypothetical protein
MEVPKQSEPVAQQPVIAAPQIASEAAPEEMEDDSNKDTFDLMADFLTEGKETSSKASMAVKEPEPEQSIEDLGAQSLAQALKNISGKSIAEIG